MRLSTDKNILQTESFKLSVTATSAAYVKYFGDVDTLDSLDSLHAYPFSRFLRISVTLSVRLYVC